MKKVIISTVIALLSVSHVLAQVTVHYVSLEEGTTISSNPVKEYPQAQDVNGGLKLDLYPTCKLQTIDGFGGAFNEIGGEALMSLPPNSRQKVVEALFSPEVSNFTLCRTAIGSSDFGRSAYSYSEVADDYKMEHFSIKREEKSVIPMLQMAHAENPLLKIFASPWSPPGWMKYSGLMDQSKTNKATSRLKDEVAIYEAYALYFAKYVEEYKKNGITIDRILVQNETDIPTKYPSCVMKPEQLSKVVGYMRSTFKKRGVKTAIWAGTFRTAAVLDMIEFASNPEWVAAVDGIGMQYTSTQFIQDLQCIAPSKPMMHTEGVCYNGQNSIKQAYSRFGEIVGYINSGVPNYCYWNMILDQTKLSGWGWAQNSLVVIDMESGDVTYTPDYAVMSLFGRFMTPGSVRVASKINDKVAITLVDGNDVRIFMKNEDDEDVIVACRERGEGRDSTLRAVIPAKSISVITYKLK